VTHSRGRRPTAGFRALGLVFAAVVTAGLLGACATSGGGSGDDSPRGGINHIPRAELEANLGPSVSLFQAVQRLRPRWLRGRRGVSGSGRRYQPVVYFDDTRYGPVQTLTRLRVADAEELRFINARDATTRYGTGVPGGVIAVTPRVN